MIPAVEIGSGGMMTNVHFAGGGGEQMDTQTQQNLTSLFLFIQNKENRLNIFRNCLLVISFHVCLLAHLTDSDDSHMALNMLYKYYLRGILFDPEDGGSTFLRNGDEFL
jgi:hypothetical protein